MLFLKSSYTKHLKGGWVQLDAPHHYLISAQRLEKMTGRVETEQVIPRRKLHRSTLLSRVWQHEHQPATSTGLNTTVGGFASGDTTGSAPRHMPLGASSFAA